MYTTKSPFPICFDIFSQYLPTDWGCANCFVIALITSPHPSPLTPSLHKHIIWCELNNTVANIVLVVAGIVRCGHVTCRDITWDTVKDLAHVTHHILIKHFPTLVREQFETFSLKPDTYTHWHTHTVPGWAGHGSLVTSYQPTSHVTIPTHRHPSQQYLQLGTTTSGHIHFPIMFISIFAKRIIKKYVKPDGW